MLVASSPGGVSIEARRLMKHDSDVAELVAAERAAAAVAVT